MTAPAARETRFSWITFPTQQEVLAIAEKWHPYRSLATSYLFSAAFEPTETPSTALHDT